MVRRKASLSYVTRALLVLLFFIRLQISVYKFIFELH